MSRKAHIYNISFRIVAGILAIFLYLLPALTVHAETAQTIAVDKTPRDFVLVLDVRGIVEDCREAPPRAINNPMS